MENPTAEAPSPSGARPWKVALGALILAGRGAAAAGRAVAGAASAGWQAIDPDVRQHLLELPLVGLTMLTPRAAPVEPLPDDGRRPVVFVHGLGGARGNFLPMRAWFGVMGRRRTYAVAFPGGEPVEALAARLADFLRSVIAVNALPEGMKVDLVAHSMGGVIARVALEDDALCARVSTLITLGTPHGGTHAARYAGLAPATQLRPDADAVALMRARWDARGERPHPRVVCFWSRADVVMLPADTAKLEGAESEELEGFSHYTFLIHPRAWQRVLARLDEG